jgi:hypothetical protein
MKCPCCKTDLQVTHQDRYESMGDGTYLRDGYQCLKESCVFNAFNVVWLSDGTIYTSPRNDMGYYMQKRILEKFVEDENVYPIGSWNYHYCQRKTIEKKETLKIEVGNYMIEIIPDFKHPEKEGDPYKKKILRTIKFWKRQENDCYAYIVPVFRMVKYVIRQFNIHKKRALEGDATKIKECFRDMKALDISGKPDGRLYTKIAATIINICWRKDCNRIFDKYIEIYGDDK